MKRSLIFFKFLREKAGRELPLLYRLLYEPEKMPDTGERYELEDDLDLTSEYEGITKLPKNLTVSGNMWVNIESLKELPEGLRVREDLDLSKGVTFISPGLRVDGILTVEQGCPLEELPNNLKVGGSLDLRLSNIKRLPDNLTLNYHLNISDTEISKLPENLTVRRSLFIGGTNISEIPKNLKVGSVFSTIDTPLSKKYTRAQIKALVEAKGGVIEGIVYGGRDEIED